VLFVAVLLTLSLSAIAQADVLAPVSAASATDLQNGMARLIGTGTGEDADPGFVHAGAVGDWFQTASTGGNGMSLSYQGVLSDIKFDLGGISTVSGAYIWNGAQAGMWSDNNFYDHSTRGVKGYDILTSVDGVTFTSTSGGAGYTLQKTVVDVPNHIAYNAPTQWQPFGATAARYLELRATSNYGSDYTVLSEIRFEGTAPTPEPSTVVLLLTGLVGLIAYAWKKR
jgi:hypothetical protein